MKKFLAMLLTTVLVLSLGASVLAVDESTNYTDMSTVTITKNYDAANDGTVSPAETFSFTIAPSSVSDAAAGVTAENMPLPTVGNVAYSRGEAGSSTKSKEITVTLPVYSSVGIYTYIINETAGDTAGVEYYGEDIRLVVTVVEQDDKVRVAAVHTEADGEAKTNKFPNNYSAGTLAVSKTVTGNLGDKTKEFEVTVTFTAPAGKTVKEAISYIDGTDNKTIASDAWEDGKASAVITLKDGETVTFKNVPYGVTYTVEEEDYTSTEKGSYDAASYTFSDTGKKIDSVTDTVGITNNKGVIVDTGITLDSLPYFVILALVVVVGASLMLKKHHSEN